MGDVTKLRVGEGLGQRLRQGFVAEVLLRRRISRDNDDEELIKATVGRVEVALKVC